MFRLGLTYFALILSTQCLAGTAVLIEEASSGVTGWKNMPHPISQGKSVIQHYKDQIFDSSYDLRLRRKVGVGATLAGTTGAYGALIELNFAPENSILVGFGGGPHYSSLAFGVKRFLGSMENGAVINPYVGVSYAHWFSNAGGAGSMASSTPAFLANRLLSTEEKNTGKFEKSLLIPALGLQYFQLDGAYKGLGVFVEADILIDASDPSPIPTGGIGSVFYF